MELIDLHSGTVDGLYPPYRECLADWDACQSLEPETRKGLSWKRRLASEALAKIDLFDALKPLDGPRKWMRDDHGTILILPIPRWDVRQQVEISVTALFQKNWIDKDWIVKDYAISFWLQASHAPWTRMMAVAHDENEAARRILDGLSKCEQQLFPRDASRGTWEEYESAS